MQQLFNMSYKNKSKIAGASLLAVGVMFEELSKNCPEMKDEISRWNEGRTFSLGVLPSGPMITVQKKGGRIKYLGAGDRDSDLIIYFKNMDAALMVFLGMIGSHTATVQGRTIVHGDLGEAMQAVRALDIVVKYLMPGFLFDNLFKRRPQMNFSQLTRKTGLMLQLLPSMALKATR